MGQDAWIRAAAVDAAVVTGHAGASATVGWEVLDARMGRGALAAGDGGVVVGSGIVSRDTAVTVGSGHMKRNCILAQRSWAQRSWAQRNGLVQPHVNVVAPDYLCGGFAWGGGASWEDPWPDDGPWQGQQEGATSPCDAGTPAYGIRTFAPLPPQSGSSPMQQQQQQLQ